jgi:Chaperone of endosialidase
MLFNQKKFFCIFLKKSIIKNIAPVLLFTCLLPFNQLKAQAWSPINPQANGLFNLPANNTFHLGRVNIGGNLFPGVLPGPNSSKLQVTNGPIAQVQAGTFGSFLTTSANTWLGLGQNPLISAYGLGMFKTNKFSFFNLEDVNRTGSGATKDLIVGFGATAGSNADQRMVFRNYTTTGASNAPLPTRDLLSLNPNGSAGFNDINPISTLFVNAVNSASSFKSIFLLNEGSVAGFPFATFCTLGQEGNSTVNAPIFGFRAQLGDNTSLQTGKVATNLQVTGIPAAPVSAGTEEVELTFQDLSTTTPISSINRFNALNFDRFGIFFRNGTNNPADKRRVLAILANGTVGVNTGAVNPITNFSGNIALPVAAVFNTPVDLDVPNGAIRTGFSYILSDKKLKKNMKNIVDPMSIISKLRGTSYNYLGRSGNLDIPTYGFIAQEVKEVMPEVVGMGSDSLLAINYDGIIPVLLEGVKEVNSKTEKTANEMERVLSAISRMESQMKEMNTWIAEVAARYNIAPPASISSDINPNGSQLLQNRPNPTNGFTEIFYELKDEGTAAINITDQQGRILKTYSNIAKGQGKIVVNKGDLKAGTYIYSLTINGKLISSRQMVIL